MKKDMATRRRGGTFVDPSKIQTFEEWIKAKASKYTNIVLGDNGDLQVWNKTGELAKVIPHLQTLDTYVAIHSDDSKLRDIAAQTIAQTKDTLAHERSVKQVEFDTLEETLLDAIRVWEHAPNSSERKQAAHTVGIVSKQLQDAANQLQTTIYPFRYIQTEIVPKKAIQYATMDDRKVSIARLVLASTDVSSRSFPIHVGI